MLTVKLTKTRLTEPQNDGLGSCHEPCMLGLDQPDSAQLDNTSHWPLFQALAARQLP